jgi:hypothetical protein
MTGTPQAAQDDTAAIAAWAAHHRFDGATAAEEWRFAVEAERARFRAVADAVMAAGLRRAAEATGSAPAGVTPARAAYERMHSAQRRRFPGIAPIAWGELDEEAQADWKDIALAAAGDAASEATYAFAKNEILANAGPEWGAPLAPEQLAIEYVRHLEAGTARLAGLVRQALDDAGAVEDAQPAYSDPPGADPSGHDATQFPTVAELGGEKFAAYPSEAGL